MKDRIWTRREIEGQIAEGRKIIIFDGQVLKADAWCPYHPGGDKAILHMVGRDGTDAIRALHSPEAQQLMQKFVVGRIQGRWDNFLPPIQSGQFRKLDKQDATIAATEITPFSSNSSSSDASPAPSPTFEPACRNRKRNQTDTASLTSASSLSLGDGDDMKADEDAMGKITADNLEADLAKFPPLDDVSQDAIVDAYRKTNNRIREAGLYKCPYSSYAIESVRYTALFLLFLICIHTSHFALAGLFVGLFWHQLVFTAHDAGHMGITHDFHTDTCIGILIADFLGGLSIGWWKRNHNIHHIVTNSPEHDPDIEHMPFLAISHRFFSSLRSTYYDRVMPFDRIAQFTVAHQNWLYYPLMLFGRFNLYRLSWEYLLSSQPPSKGPAWWHRYLELVGQAFFWYWYGYKTIYLRIPTGWDRFVFIMISHMVTAPLHVQITLSHFAMSTSDMGVNESFPQTMIRTTMDVDCPTWLDFVHGGLQFQAVHHLYPRIPRHNLRKAQVFVREFCEEVRLPYTIYGFGEGNQQVIGRLGEVAKQVRIYEECRRHAAKELVEGHNH